MMVAPPYPPALELTKGIDTIANTIMKGPYTDHDFPLFHYFAYGFYLQTIVQPQLMRGFTKLNTALGQHLNLPIQDMFRFVFDVSMKGQDLKRRGRQLALRQLDHCALVLCAFAYTPDTMVSMPPQCFQFLLINARILIKARDWSKRLSNANISAAVSSCTNIVTDNRERLLHLVNACRHDALEGMKFVPPQQGQSVTQQLPIRLFPGQTSNVPVTAEASTSQTSNVPVTAEASTSQTSNVPVTTDPFMGHTSNPLPALGALTHQSLALGAVVDQSLAPGSFTNQSLTPGAFMGQDLAPETFMDLDLDIPMTGDNLPDVKEPAVYNTEAVDSFIDEVLGSHIAEAMRHSIQWKKDKEQNGMTRTTNCVAITIPGDITKDAFLNMWIDRGLAYAMRNNLDMQHSEILNEGMVPGHW
ncbi:hypothetical protein F4679DRAFT_558568 [Xylaria curta]|nr:hypothetical protein F4679DRAFT_558568 [Xylaria curta]